MKRNPHIQKLESLAIVGIFLGVIVAVFGGFNSGPIAALLMPLGIALVALGVFAYLLGVAAAAITWRPGDK